MKLTCLLLNEDVKEFRDALARPTTEYRVSASLAADARLYVDSSSSGEPPWLEIVRKFSPDALPGMSGQINSGLMLIRVDDRMLAFTFGGGRRLLKQDIYEPRFGLKVTVNRVNPDSLKSLDAHSYEAGQLQVRRQAARKSGLDAFGINPARDILRAVAGVAASDDLVSGAATARAGRKRILSTLAGRDSFTAAVSGTITSLDAYCRNLLAAASDATYQERFGWIDQLQPISHAKLEKQLVKELLKQLNAGTISTIDLALPELVDPEDFMAVRYPKADPNTELEDDLDFEQFLKALKKASIPIDEDLLKMEIGFYRSDDGAVAMRRKVWECLAAEISYKGNDFVLNGGGWFQVSASFVKEIDDYLKNELPKCSLALPDALDCADEAAYNKKLENNLPDALLQDQKLVGLRGVSGTVEPCDVLVAPDKFIHVKRKTRSATLSHLLAQGHVSAELFRDSKEFVKAWKTQRLKGVDAKFTTMVGGKWKRDKFEVVYVIVTNDPSKVPIRLPFFAKVHLRQTARALVDLGYKVSIGAAEESVKKTTKPKKPKAVTAPAPVKGKKP